TCTICFLDSDLPPFLQHARILSVSMLWRREESRVNINTWLRQVENWGALISK
ncbi:hypothetical protein S83_005818, partial [Arachis hypogaea]